MQLGIDSIFEIDHFAGGFKMMSDNIICIIVRKLVQLKFSHNFRHFDKSKIIKSFMVYPKIL